MSGGDSGVPPISVPPPPGWDEAELFSPEILNLAEVGLVEGVLLPDEIEALCRAVLRLAGCLGL